MSGTITGAHKSVTLSQQPRQGAAAEVSQQRLYHHWWRWPFRLFRFEEAILLALLAIFAVVFLALPNTPTLDSLWGGFTYNFHGRGTMWVFLLWCSVGTAFLLLVAMLPLAGKGAARALLHGVWGENRSLGGRIKATTFWGLAGLRAYAPFLACMGVYEMNKRLIPALRGDTLYDVPMAQFEYWLLGDLSAAMVRKFMHQEWVTSLISLVDLTQSDIHEACYISYVYAAPALALGMWFLGRRTQFNRFMGALAITGALAYVGYVLVPVVGPKYVFEGRWLEASTSALSFMDDIKDMNRDCFPSLHTAWTTLFLIAAWHGVRPLFWVYLPVGIGVYISTLYGGYHYIPDILAGHALAVFAWWAARPLREWWDRRAGKVKELAVSAS